MPVEPLYVFIDEGGDFNFSPKGTKVYTITAVITHNPWEAEDNYYITTKYLLDIANRAYNLFIRSEVEERRQLVKLVLHNLRLEGKLVRYDALKPFDTILNYNDNQLGLRD